jgi:fructuronate reductase
MAMNRLHPSTLAAVPSDTSRPRYDRDSLRAGIVHLGVGAFHRAHLAAATEAAIHASGDLRWGIVGVSLRRADTRDALSPQAGLYTLCLRDAADDGGPREEAQVIGALTRLLVAPEDPSAVVARIAHADTRIVSLTVTEKGYHQDPASGELRLADADIAHDISRPLAPCSTIGILVRGLHLRMKRERSPLTLLSCDNLPNNGRRLRALVLAFAEHVDASLHAWILSRCTFPNSMVDRIVPPTCDADRERIAQRLGLHDAWPVVAEPFFDWVIEDQFAAGRPAWDDGGARFVERAEPYERVKLRMVNGSHSALAYLGMLAGLETVDQTIASAPLCRFANVLMRDEIAPTLPAVPGLDLDAHRARLLKRFANPALRHALTQIAMDGSQKLPQRLLDTVRDRLRAETSIDHLALAVAAWMQFLRGRSDGGVPHAIDDPLAQPLAAQLRQADDAADDISDPEASERRRVQVFAAFEPVFGDLGREALFVRAVARQTMALRRQGAMATLEAIA